MINFPRLPALLGSILIVFAGQPTVHTVQRKKENSTTCTLKHCFATAKARDTEGGMENNERKEEGGRRF